MFELLITARDPATALAFSGFIKHLSADKRFNITVIAQPPADRFLKMINLGNISIVDNEQQAKSCLIKKHSTHNFSAVLVGVSGPDIGIDEYTIEFAKQHQITCFAHQGFWGDFNPSATSVPDFVFTIDRLANQLNFERFPQVNNITIGSLKHKELNQVDSQALRQQGRDSLNLTAPLLIGFYGQPLATVNGYLATIASLAKQLSRWNKSFQVMYRPHPKESSQLQSDTIALFEQYLANQYIVDPFIDINQSIVVCDLVTSAFSTCCIDAVYLNRYAPSAINSSLFLWFNNNLISWWQDYNQMIEMPMSGKNGLIHSVDNEDDLLTVFEQALAEKENVRLKAKDNLPNATRAYDTMIQAILKNSE